MDNPVRACVIGHPLSHSLSPVIHNYWFKYNGIIGDYVARPIDPEKFAVTITSLADTYQGFNVTIPYKQTIIPFCATIDAAAKSIGAVNTVIIDATGQLLGRNTDAYGFAENLQQSRPDFDWTAGPALVLGAGGAARAVIHALKDRGVPDIVITNRSADKAALLADQFNVRTLPWQDRISCLPSLNLLVNTTALGMNGQPTLDLALDTLSPNATVYDIVYAPLMTDLLQAALARGNPIVTGLGMLLHQAVPAFEAWTGIRPTVDATLERLLLEKTL